VFVSCPAVAGTTFTLPDIDELLRVSEFDTLPAATVMRVLDEHRAMLHRERDVRALLDRLATPWAELGAGLRELAEGTGIRAP
jgi:hypothetical protein